MSLSELSVRELQKLHFDEECIFCEKVLGLPRFSSERKEVLNKGYEFAITVKEEIGKKKGVELISHGATKHTIKLLKKLVKEKLSESNDPIALYEAGVGYGYAIENILSRFRKEYESGLLTIKGCDIFLQPRMSSLMEVNPLLDITKDDIFDSLSKLPNNSIDVFYADNVIEHFLPDEAETILSEIAKKMKQGAYFYVFIPNKYIGPGDVSRYFLPLGSKALGTHFMEMSFNEITKLMGKYSFHHTYCVGYIPKTSLIFCIKKQALIKIKLKMEPILRKIPTRFLRRVVFALSGYSVSVMRKTT